MIGGVVQRSLALLPDAMLLALARLLDAVRRRRRRPMALALVYHRVAPRPGDVAHELLPAIATADFARQLGWVTRRYRPVRADQLLDAARERTRGGALPLAVTFDDDSATHHEHARGPLAATGVPATFFLCGGTLEGPRGYWWEDLQAVHDRGELTAAALPHVDPSHGNLFGIAAAIERLGADERRDVAAALRELVGPPVQPGLPTAAVRDLAGDGHEIGFHTVEHHTLPTLADGELETALRDGREALTAAAGARPSSIAYPSGRYDRRTAPAARAAGFAAGFTTSGFGWDPSVDALLIGRVEPRSPSLGVFALKIALASWGRAG